MGIGNSKLSQLVTLCACVGLAFFLGFWRGQESILSLNISSNIEISPSPLDASVFGNSLSSNRNDAGTAQSIGADVQLSEAQGSEAKPSLNAPLDSAANGDEENIAVVGLTGDASASELIDYLVQIATSDNPDDMQHFAKTMDQLRAAVKNDPNAVQALIEHFMGADAEAKSPYYIISVLQGADLPNREQVFANLAQRLAGQGNPLSQAKLLHLVSSTGLQDSFPEATNMVTDIALYADTDTKLYALDLLMPYQLDANQKYVVLTDLKQSLNSLDEDQRSYAIEHIMRFSDASEREQMAKDYLSTVNDLNTRVAVLSSLHSGTLAPSDTLKTQLFAIARDSSDPLSRHAKHALMNVFDINNDEYQALKTP